MANICSNFITLVGKPAQLKRAIKLIMSDESPCGDVDLCWPAEETTELDKLPAEGTAEISYSCESRWSPPIEWFVQLCGELDIVGEVEYEECGTDFAGVYRVFRNGDKMYGQDHCASYIEWRFAVSDDHENEKGLWAFANDLESLSDEDRDAKWAKYTEGFAEDYDAFLEAHQAEREEIKRDMHSLLEQPVIQAETPTPENIGDTCDN